MAKRLQWMKPYTKVKDVNWDISKTNNPADLHVKWFHDGTLNVSANCIDRHLPHKANDTAIIFEGDDPNVSKTDHLWRAPRPCLPLCQRAESRKA